MEIHVYDEMNGSGKFSVEELSALAPVHLSAGERVEGVAGRAFDWLSWYGAWRQQRKGSDGPVPTHLRVVAADEFQATIPWTELDQALFLYAQEDGTPLKKGYPIRLYVPDGNSACLNVKSVVAIHLLYNEEASESEFGFKNKVSPDELREFRGRF
ncbi:hypothetical protein O9H85_13660 [Paenibacillus filicis]|uniref:Oxidoreductase molybdopterin-binding domain-containing protein n=1 Tax=Paenibacillus gyeongsangnamensis TaxID=3388067 RepID=A0ABT4Q9A6_9BACL|nr:hypothetical protein [Paenibacillus filicis]MCZ8513458.1 hypothetical protein [Paenibacillus filicis]